MSKVILNISMSLDGYVAGPHVRPEAPMGDNGELLHDWMSGDSAASWTEAFSTNIGAYIMGRRTFDVGEAPWGNEPPFHAACFVLTGRPQATIAKAGGTSFVFVDGGAGAALQQARQAANGQDIIVMGGARVAQQFLQAGLIDEFQLHLAHVLLGGGSRLFKNVSLATSQLEKISVDEAPGATRLRFRVPR